MQSKNVNYQFYNRNLKSLANAMRNDSTRAEACLWKHVLRAGQMMGYTFRRQRPLMNYIIDFVCQPLWLAIELDGKVHSVAEVSVNDAKRQLELEAAGFTVIRFSNADILLHIHEVKRKIELWIEEYEERFGIPANASRVTARRKK